MTSDQSNTAPAGEPATTSTGAEDGATEQGKALFGDRAAAEQHPQPNVTELPAATLIADEPADPDER